MGHGPSRFECASLAVDRVEKPRQEGRSLTVAALIGARSRIGGWSACAIFIKLSRAARPSTTGLEAYPTPAFGRCTGRTLPHGAQARSKGGRDRPLAPAPDRAEAHRRLKPWLKPAPQGAVKRRGWAFASSWWAGRLLVLWRIGRPARSRFPSLFLLDPVGRRPGCVARCDPC